MLNIFHAPWCPSGPGVCIEALSAAWGPAKPVSAMDRDLAALLPGGTHLN